MTLFIAIMGGGEREANPAYPGWVFIKKDWSMEGKLPNPKADSQVSHVSSKLVKK